MDEIKPLTLAYGLDAVYLGRAHYKEADRSDKWQWRLGTISVVLGALVGSTIFAAAKGSPAFWQKMAVGLVALTSTILAGLQTFAGFATRASRNRTSGASYEALSRELELFWMGLDQNDDERRARKELGAFETRLSQLQRSSPLVPPCSYDEAVNEIAGHSGHLQGRTVPFKR